MQLCSTFWNNKESLELDFFFASLIVNFIPIFLKWKLYHIASWMKVMAEGFCMDVCCF